MRSLCLVAILIVYELLLHFILVLKRIQVCFTRNRGSAWILTSLAVVFFFGCFLLCRHFNIEYHIPSTCTAKDCTLQRALLYTALPQNFLLIMIHSRATGKKIRDIIRKTWVSDLKKDVIEFRFVLGVSQIPEDLMEELKKESLEYNDLMLMTNVTDSKETLTRRTFESFSEVVTKFKFQYALKCDDDSIADVQRIATELFERKRRDRLYWGYFSGAKFLMSFGPYTETRWYICEKYTPIAAGGGYIVSRDVAELLAKNKDVVTWYIAEDATVSAVLSPYNIERKHDTRFNTPGWPSRGCKKPYLMSHQIDDEHMSLLYESLTTEGSLCSSKTHWHLFIGYLYNWTALPSNCCRINYALP